MEEKYEIQLFPKYETETKTGTENIIKKMNRINGILGKCVLFEIKNRI